MRGRVWFSKTFKFQKLITISSVYVLSCFWNSKTTWSWITEIDKDFCEVKTLLRIDHFGIWLRWGKSRRRKNNKIEQKTIWNGEERVYFEELRTKFLVIVSWKSHLSKLWANKLNLRDKGIRCSTCHTDFPLIQIINMHKWNEFWCCLLFICTRTQTIILALYLSTKCKILWIVWLVVRFWWVWVSVKKPTLFHYHYHFNGK